jgi:hypothetical protein
MRFGAAKRIAIMPGSSEVGAIARHLLDQLWPPIAALTGLQ